MRDIEILKKAIEKALHNNWEQMLPFVPTWALEQANEDRLVQHIIKTYGKSIIFSHDFAKAFFPKTDEHSFHKDDAWKYYLQQMVLEEEPLKYLEKYL
ncbi:MAG TPA: hypothetical protein VEP90_02010 [Methylomirabilota bacterium]|nr:hypothetical protein [Methylomirabilota bacterium]